MKGEERAGQISEDSKYHLLGQRLRVRLRHDIGEQPTITVFRDDDTRNHSLLVEYLGVIVLHEVWMHRHVLLRVSPISRQRTH